MVWTVVVCLVLIVLGLFLIRSELDDVTKEILNSRGFAKMRHEESQRSLEVIASLLASIDRKLPNPDQKNWRDSSESDL